MKKGILAVILITTTTLSFAGEKTHPVFGSNPSSSKANSASFSGASSTVNIGSDYNAEDIYKNYVAPAVAPDLAATGDCLGSASAGGSNSVMGFSLGKTYVDENCNARMDSRHLWSMGFRKEAVLRLCSQIEMARVLGRACEPVNGKEAVEALKYKETKFDNSSFIE